MIDLNNIIFKSKIENHSKIKKSILDSISSMGTNSLVNSVSRENIFNTDWHLDSKIPRPYFEIVEYYLFTHCEKVPNYYGYKDVLISNMWFQQYKPGDYHRFHVHPKSVFSNVYYVDISENTPKTTFLFKGKETYIPVEEGDVLTFPSFLVHNSPKNIDNKIKTVISFNSDAYL
jgi:hypothetical protein